MNEQYNNYGNCKFCGAQNIVGQKGMPYCSRKCWLNKPTQQGQYQGQYPRQQKPETDWNAVSERDFLHREWTAAKISAKDVIVALIQQKELDIKQLRPAIKDLAVYLYNLKQPQENNEPNKIQEPNKIPEEINESLDYNFSQ